jgi:transcriptional regulator with XRE-family HTH domain
MKNEESAMPTLGEELKRLRALKGWSLRQVEEKTDNKVSNSYLSQLESGAVREPSPNVLYALAKAYNVSYPALMTLAGYVVPRAGHGKPVGQGSSVAFNAINLSPEEEQVVLDFIQFRRQQKQKRDS